MNIICNNIYIRQYIIIIILLSVSIILSACNGPDKPIPSNLAKVKMLSDNKMILETFEIPNSIFRGVLWPSKENANFQVWIIEGREDKYYNIPPPINFTDYTEITKQWDIQAVKRDKDSILYKIIKSDESISLELKLPLKKKNYTFSVLNNELNNYLILFMDISEDIKDKGLFGYILIH